MQAEVENVYRYKPKAKRLLWPVLFFLGGFFIVACEALALSTVSSLRAGFLWLIAFASLAYGLVPIWWQTRDQNITITSTGIRIPKSPFSSSQLDIPYKAVFYVRVEEHQCGFSYSFPERRGVFFIKRSLLPSKQAFEEICRVLSDRASMNSTQPA